MVGCSRLFPARGIVKGPQRRLLRSFGCPIRILDVDPTNVIRDETGCRAASVIVMRDTIPLVRRSEVAYRFAALAIGRWNVAFGPRRAPAGCRARRLLSGQGGIFQNVALRRGVEYTQNTWVGWRGYGL